MIKIRNEQFEVLQRETESAFAREMVAYLKEHEAELVSRVPEDVLLLMVRTGIARARSRGLSFRSSIATFVTTMFVTAPNFDDFPSIRDRLTGGDAPADYGMNSVIEATPECDWEAVRLLSDHAAWGEAAARLPRDWNQR